MSVFVMFSIKHYYIRGINNEWVVFEESHESFRKYFGSEHSTSYH